MASPSLELQGAIVTRLKADVAVSSLVGERIYDHVPRGAGGAVTADYPFVGFASRNTVRDDVACVTGYEVTISLDVWSRAVGTVEAQRIVDAVTRSLHNWSPTLPSHVAVTFQHRNSIDVGDPDGLTSHFVVEFVATVTE